MKIEKPLDSKISWVYSFLILFLIFLFLGTFVAYLIYDRYKSNTESLLNQEKSITSLGAITVNEKINKVLDVGFALSTRVQFQKLVASGQWEDAVKIMEKVPTTFNYVADVALFTTSGIFTAITPSTPETNSLIGSDVSNRGFYKGVSKNWKPYISEAFTKQSVPKYDVIAVAIPIIPDPDTGAIGIVVLAIKIDTIVSWTNDIRFKKSNFFIVDQKGQVISNRTTTQLGNFIDLSSVPVVQRILKGEHGVVINWDNITNKEVLSTFEPISNVGWGIFTKEPTKSLFAYRDMTLKNDIVIWSFIIFTLELVLYIFIYNWKKTKDQLDREKNLISEIKQKSDMLELANKELTSFSYSVSHDLRAPLRAIDGFSNILLEDYSNKLDADGKHIIENIHGSTKQMGNLIDDLLTYSRLGRQSVKVSKIDMTTLVKNVFDEIKMINPKRKIQFSCTELPAVQGDQILMRQVWVNLISNAVKFTSKKEVAEINIGSTVQNENFIYFVKDNGVGFNMKYVSKLFEVFQRLHSAEQFEGTGIGLSIVSTIIKKHGGKVWAEGAENQGATFYFSIPKNFSVL